MPEPSTALWVTLDDFEGELTRLLQLVREDRARLWRISLHQLIVDVAARIEGLEESGILIEVASHLVTMKTDLLLLSAKAGDLDSQEAALRQKAEAEAKLVEYREVVRRIREREGEEVFQREAPEEAGELVPFPPAAATDDENFSLEDLEESLIEVSAQEPEAPTYFEPEVFKVSDAAEEILSTLAEVGRFPFSYYDDQDLPFRIVLFLALLELVRQRALQAAQEDRDSDIWMEER